MDMHGVTNVVRGRWTGVSVVLVVAISGCKGVTLPEYPPDFEGTVAAVEEDIPFEGLNRPNKIWIVASPDDECGTITGLERAEIALRTADGRLRRGDFGDIKMGRAVRLWYRGNVADSCPGGGAARAIEVSVSR